MRLACVNKYYLLTYLILYVTPVSTEEVNIWQRAFTTALVYNIAVNVVLCENFVNTADRY